VSYLGWHEPDSHGLEDFICGFLGGAIGFFNFPGWLFIYFGWLSVMSVGLLCIGVGLLFGAWMVYEHIKAK